MTISLEEKMRLLKADEEGGVIMYRPRSQEDSTWHKREGISSWNFTTMEYKIEVFYFEDEDISNAQYDLDGDIILNLSASTNYVRVTLKELKWLVTMSEQCLERELKGKQDAG